MIGIEFDFETTYQKILYKLLRNINIENYKWIIVQQEIIFEEDLNKKLTQYLSGAEFKNEIINKGNYYINQLNLQAYLNSSNVASIKNYQDFANSECELIILFSDNKFIELYAKNNQLLNQIINNIKELGIEYQIKTKENDGRTEMFI